MWYRGLFGAAGVAAALVLSIAAAAAHDASKYPDWSGMWRRTPGTGIVWDETKKPGLDQNPPITDEYRKLWEESIADQKAGGQGADTRVTCRSSGMPRLATIVRPIGFFIQDDMTLVVYDNYIPRWIYTDGRDFPKDPEQPSYAGYSIGKWTDTDGDGRFDTLTIETRQFKGPRIYDETGISLHHDNESVIVEKLSLDKSDKNVLRNEITTYDHALTQPWTVTKRYWRIPGKVEFHEDLCNEDNMHVQIGKEGYILSGDGMLMPTKKNQAPPDLRYFKPTQK